LFFFCSRYTHVVDDHDDAGSIVDDLAFKKRLSSKTQWSTKYWLL